MTALHESVQTIRFIEELALNGWPALTTLCYDGWLLRFANNYTRRANSVSPLYESSLDLHEKIRYCEAVYAQYGQSAIFKLTEATHPPDLDQVLNDQGYAVASPSTVMVLDTLDDQPAPEYQDVVLLYEITSGWIDNFVALSGTAQANIPTMRQMLASIHFPKAFITLNEGSKPVAMGMAVIERGYVCFNDIVVAADKRQQGYGLQLMRHLIAWAKANSAAYGYLQVLSDNHPAIRLYTRLGFHEGYRYWYRVKQTNVDMRSAF